MEQNEGYDDIPLWHMYLKNHESTCLNMAIRFKIFDIVKTAESPISRCDLIEKAGMGKRSGEILLAVLTSLNYLAYINGKYELTEISKNHLTSDSPNSWVNVFAYNSKMNVSTDSQVEKAIRLDETGVLEWNVVDMWHSGEIGADSANGFTQFMETIHKNPSRVLAYKFKLREHGITSILDVAGGSGCFSIQFTKQQPGTKSTILEMPEVCKLTQNYINKAGQQDKIFTYACDMFTEPFPAWFDPKYGYNAIFLSNILHDWDEEVAQTLCNKCYASLPDNGHILIFEALLDDDKTGPLIPALFSFDLFLTLKGGRQYTFSEISQFLKKAGFKEINLAKNISGIFSLICAKK